MVVCFTGDADPKRPVPRLRSTAQQLGEGDLSARAAVATGGEIGDLGTTFNMEVLREQIQTVFRLEVLLLLHRNQSRSFAAADVSRELGFDDEMAQQQLTKLAAPRAY